KSRCDPTTNGRKKLILRPFVFWGCPELHHSTRSSTLSRSADNAAMPVPAEEVNTRAARALSRIATHYVARRGPAGPSLGPPVAAMLAPDNVIGKARDDGAAAGGLRNTPFSSTRRSGQN